MKKSTDRIYRSLPPVFCCVAFLALLLSVPVTLPHDVNAQGRRYSLRIQNDSRYDIHRLYVSRGEEEKWGPDQLRDNILRSGSSYTLTNIVPGEYDIKFVDEDGDKCILRNIAIFKTTSWVLTTKWLVDCERSNR